MDTIFIAGAADDLEQSKFAFALQAFQTAVMVYKMKERFVRIGGENGKIEGDAENLSEARSVSFLCGRFSVDISKLSMEI